jgi:hypothetical protein
VPKLKLSKVVPFLLLVVSSLAAQAFKAYPGATKYKPPDTEESREAAKALPAGTESVIYLSNDSFEKVFAFYKDLGKEYAMPGMKRNKTLPSGQPLTEAYFIFDGAADLAASRNWAKIQRPYVGSVTFKGGKPEYNDVRDITAIVVLQKK